MWRLTLRHYRYCEVEAHPIIPWPTTASSWDYCHGNRISFPLVPVSDNRHTQTCISPNVQSFNPMRFKALIFLTHRWYCFIFFVHLLNGILGKKTDLIFSWVFFSTQELTTGDAVRTCYHIRWSDDLNISWGILRMRSSPVYVHVHCFPTSKMCKIWHSNIYVYLALLSCNYEYSVTYVWWTSVWACQLSPFCHSRTPTCCYHGDKSLLECMLPWQPNTHWNSDVIPGLFLCQS